MGGSWAEAVRRDPDPAAPVKPLIKTPFVQNADPPPSESSTSQENGAPPQESVSPAAPITGSDVGSQPTSEIFAGEQGGRQLLTLVVDTNALINGKRLDNFAENLVTITEVFEEIRDKQTRQLVAGLPYEIRTREPSDAALKEVVRFARATGDLHSLSPPDIKLIALTYTVEAEIYGTAHIRKEPPPIAVAKKSQGRIKEPPGWGRVPNPADWAGIDEVGDDGKRHGSSGSSRMGGSKILGVKPLDAETAIVTSESEKRQGKILEGLREGLEGLGGGQEGSREGSEGLGDGSEGLRGSSESLEKGPEQVEKVSGPLAALDLEEGSKEGGSNGQNEGAGLDESKSEGGSEAPKAEEKQDAPVLKSATAWGGFTAAPPKVLPLPGNSLLTDKINESVQSSENAVPSEEVSESAGKASERTFHKRGGGRGGGRGRGRGAKASVPTKSVVVDGVHAVRVEEQAIEHAEGGDDWEKNVSRSTRRKHQRRAERMVGSGQPPESEKGTTVQQSEELNVGGGENGENGSKGGLHLQGVAKAGEETNGQKDSNEELPVQGIKEGGEENSEGERALESMQGLEESCEVKGIASIAGVESNGQFSDAEEDDDEAEETKPEETNQADEINEDVGSKASEQVSEEYEYAYQNREGGEETASVAPSEGGNSEWDRASSLPPGRESEVACMTSDFAMQNVILQMGLRLLSVDGLGISQLHRWALRCQACGQVTHEMGRIFCPKCGNGGTLNKVTVMVGEDGALVAGIRKRFSLRGTRYPIPLPKGGREGKQSDPILREDQLPSRIRHGLGPRKKKGEVDVFGAEYGPETWFQAVPMKGVSHNAVHVKNAAAAFNSRKNPNERRVARKK